MFASLGSTSPNTVHKSSLADLGIKAPERYLTHAELPIAGLCVYSLKCNRMDRSVVRRNPEQSELATVRIITHEKKQCSSWPWLDQTTNKVMARLHLGRLVPLAMPRMQLRTSVIGRGRV